MPRSLAWEGWKENGNVADACPVMQEMADLFMRIDGPSWAVRWGGVRSAYVLARHTESHEPKIKNHESRTACLHFGIQSLTQQKVIHSQPRASSFSRAWYGRDLFICLAHGAMADHPRIPVGPPGLGDSGVEWRSYVLSAGNEEEREGLRRKGKGGNPREEEQRRWGG